MRRTATRLAIALLVVAGVATLIQREPEASLPLPPRGEVAPAFLPDGRPVFVVHRPDGEVAMLDALSPHKPHEWWKLAGWCPSADIFEEPWHGSRFTPEGLWFAGPSPTGLPAYTARAVGGDVLVGRRGPAPPREAVRESARQQTGEPLASGPSCLGDTPAESLAAGLVTHDALLPAGVPGFREALREAGGGWVPAHGMLLQVRGEPIRLCREVTGSPPACPDGLAWRTPAPPGVPSWMLLRGRFLVRGTSDRIEDVVLLADVKVVHSAMATRPPPALSDPR